MAGVEVLPRRRGASIHLPGGGRVVWSTRDDGDLRVACAGSAGALAAMAGRPVVRVDQVHGSDVLVVDAEVAAAGPTVWTGDALVTSSSAVALAVLTADCASLALSSHEGVVGAVHAGWRGLVAGVVESAVATMRSLGATQVVGALGPCIRPGCYPFAEAELASVVGRFGDRVRGVSVDGRPALDLPAAVRVALEGAGGALVHDEGICTACAAERCFSHRARHDVGRQAMVVWKA